MISFYMKREESSLGYICVSVRYDLCTPTLWAGADDLATGRLAAICLQSARNFESVVV